MDKKLSSIVLEYSLRKNNEHVGSGLGGNVEYYMYLMSKNNEFSSKIKDIEIQNDVVIFNPDFISNSSRREIRNILDQKIKESIEKEKFISPISDDCKIDWDTVSNEIKEIDPDSILTGIDFDVSKFDLTNQVMIAMRVCARLSYYLDNETDKAKTFYNAFSKFMKQFDSGISLFAIRAQIGLERLVSHNMDEDKYLGPLFHNINNLVA